MRTPVLTLLLFLASSLPAVVSLEGVQWASDSAKPTATGIAYRTQVYFLVDFTDEAGRNKYWSLREFCRDTKLATRFDVLHFLIAVDGAIEPARDGEAKEFWCKGVSGNHGLVRAFGGDALAVIVLVDGKRSVVSNPCQRRSALPWPPSREVPCHLSAIAASVRHVGLLSPQRGIAVQLG